MQWYYALNGQRLGPISQNELVKLVTDGVVRAETLVWTQGMAQWATYGSVSAASTPSAAAAAPASLPVVTAPASDRSASAASAAASTGASAALDAQGTIDDGTEVCAVSGKRYPRSEMIKHGAIWISYEHRDAFFQQKKETVATRNLEPATTSAVAPYGYAGFWIRFLADIFDNLLFSVVAGIVITLAFFLMGMIGVVINPAVAIGVVIIFCLSVTAVTLALHIVYYVYFTRKYDATPGKLALGLKVVKSDGSKLSTGCIIGRFFARILSGLFFCIGYIIAGFDDQKRALHDHICDTRVVKTK